MCDTLARIISDNYAIFGKNSDRAVNEPQIVEYYPAQNYPDKCRVRCTYISIDQVTHTNAVVLSRPSWIWGGEIGVNEYGLCIGNEAVFTKDKYGKESLIGMDLLRLALERADSAINGVKVIIDLLQQYGQGGNCGYDSEFEYNNSFLLMDRKEIYVLETVGKDYVYKKYDHASISNRLTIHDDGDVYKNKKCDFAKKYSDLIMTFGSHGKERRTCTFTSKLDNLEDMFAILRSHEDAAQPFVKGSVSSVCMHASNSLTADQTTMSMVVELKEDGIIIWLTGCSLPCVSLFKPALFKENGLIYPPNSWPTYWHAHEMFNRSLLSCQVDEQYTHDLLLAQKRIINLCKNGVDDEVVENAMKIDTEFSNRVYEYNHMNTKSSWLFNRFWQEKNEVFEKEMKE